MEKKRGGNGRLLLFNIPKLLLMKTNFYLVARYSSNAVPKPVNGRKYRWNINVCWEMRVSNRKGVKTKEEKTGVFSS